MRTERLFYKDSHQTTCQAKVLECREVKKGYEILLDQTVFYPEGGGQPCDIGTMNQVEVTDVQEKDGEIWHRTREAIPEGTEVNCKIDWERRFDLMQQHSGEHLISGLIHEKYGYNNVGFHIGSETVTLDVDGEVPEEFLKEIEAKANQYVWENHPVEITHPSEEERKTLPYRSKKELTGDVRIVTWPGGMRIEMLCGKRALEYTNQLKEQNRRISQLLSAKWNDTADAVEKLQKEYQQLKFRMVGMELKKIETIAAQTAGCGDQLFFEEDMSPDSVRKLASDVMESCGGRCAVFNGNDENGYRYIIGEKDGDLREFVKEMNQKLQGRGGGKPFFVQGSVQASRKEIETFFAS